MILSQPVLRSQLSQRKNPTMKTNKGESFKISWGTWASLAVAPGF